MLYYKVYFNRTYFPVSWLDKARFTHTGYKFNYVNGSEMVEEKDLFKAFSNRAREERVVTINEIGIPKNIS
jgi:hypothetical protein